MLYDKRGQCPHCHKSSGFRTIGANHYGFCETHETYWWIGLNQNTGNPGEQRNIWEENVGLFKNWKRTDGHDTPELPP